MSTTLLDLLSDMAPLITHWLHDLEALASCSHGTRTALSRVYRQRMGRAAWYALYCTAFTRVPAGRYQLVASAVRGNLYAVLQQPVPTTAHQLRIVHEFVRFDARLHYCRELHAHGYQLPAGILDLAIELDDLDFMLWLVECGCQSTGNSMWTAVSHRRGALLPHIRDCAIDEHLLVDVALEDDLDFLEIMLPWLPDDLLVRAARFRWLLSGEFHLGSGGFRWLVEHERIDYCVCDHDWPQLEQLYGFDWCEQWL